MDFDRAPEIGEFSDEAANGLRFVAVLEVKGAEIAVFDAVAEHVVAGGEHGCGDGEDCLLGATTRLDTEKLRLEIAVLSADGGPSGGDERGLEPVATLADSRRAAL